MKKIFIVLSAAFLFMSSAEISFAKDNVVDLPKISNLSFAVITDNASTQLTVELNYSDIVIDITETRLTLVVLVYITPTTEQFYPILLSKSVKELLEEGRLLIEKETDASGKICLTITFPHNDKINEKNYITGVGMTIADLPGRVSFPVFVNIQ